MNNRGRLFLSGLISAGIHAYVVIAADPRIDPLRLKPPVRESLQVTLAARASAPEPPPENPADPGPVAPVEEESADSPEQVAKPVLAQNIVPRKKKAVAPKARKSKKAPRRAAVKPTSRKRKKRKTKGAVKGSDKRKSVQSRRPAGTKAGKSSANKATKAGSRPKASSGRVRKPTPNYRPHPKYPRSARRKGLEGTVVLRVLVNTSGRVGQCRVHKSSGHRILDERAAKTVRKWTFRPGKKGAKPSAMWVKVPIRFELK